MILVDTSALVSFLKGARTAAALYLEEIVVRGEPFALTPLVVQETLQGARDDVEWRRLRSYLLSQEMLLAKDPLAAHVRSARLYFECRRRGLTVRSTIDCLIADVALEHRAALLHDDRDFEAIRRVRPLLTLP